MRKDYHLHPTVLTDSKKIEMFIQKALEKNIKEICVTDHMPLSISKASDRIPRGMIREYCHRVCEISKIYENRICIKCGIEIDFHPSVISEVEQVLEEGEFDFILASSHMHLFINNYSRYTFNDFAALALENSIKAVEFGRFNAISHLDMYRWVFENPQRFSLKNDEYDVFKHKALINDFLDKIANNNMYLEINPHLAESKQNMIYTYPEQPIVEWALEKGVRFSYGSDAHTSDSVGAYLCELEEHPLYGKAIKGWEGDI